MPRPTEGAWVPPLAGLGERATPPMSASRARTPAAKPLVPCQAPSYIVMRSKNSGCVQHIMSYLPEEYT